MKKWEYNVLYWDAPIYSYQESMDLNETLNEYGIDGWEVVSMSHQVDSSSSTDDGSVSSVETNAFIIVMKREYQE
ncbi:DUF4177 domain-containing protein [Bacillus chungangensis]|uniref:DUF4177 domain-containing protein n=1 Tax=Bacillus chungangensis TaxID=587633 RepID=A0ABT9WRT6_9BACI|nr:DUF4177 domain-containing protein [Bacillus chungangensis]MDQ0176004.1 hypothetical protein [Bacillus chungangensis]